MTRPQNGTISTRSIDTAAYIIAATDQDCSVSFLSGSIASFIFSSDSSTRNALISFETGGEVEGKKLLDARNQLFRRIKGVRP
jgi:hypothetical protein